LLLNSFEAVSGDHGRVTVSARERENHVEFSVQDNGPGIPEEIRTRLFEPFVSSGKQNGTGLGLTVVQKIVQDHGGEISFQSGASGTNFQIILPLASSSKSDLSEHEIAKATTPMTGNGT